jgi:uncharacterized membrane protein
VARAPQPFTQLRYVDPVLLRLNLVLLLAAAFLPFPTAVLSRPSTEPRRPSASRILFYGATALVIELVLRIAVAYAASKPELTHAHHKGEPLPQRPGPWRETSNAVRE